MPLPEESSMLVCIPTDRTTWSLALIVLLALLYFGWSRTGFLPAALVGSGLACGARLIGNRYGGIASRATDVLVLAAVLFPLAILSASVLGQALDFIAGMLSPLAVNPIEGREAFKAWLLSCGCNIYTGPSHGGDILITLYGPLYYGLAALAERILGPGLFPARLVSLAALLALVVAIFILVRRETGSVAAALLVVCALFTAPLLEYGHFARPDMTSWAFFFLAACAFQHALKEPLPAKALVTAVLLAVCALLTKQQTWPPLAGLFLYGLLCRRFKVTAVFALGSLGLGAMAFLVLNRITGGEFLFQTLVFPKLMAGLADLNTNAFAFDRMRVFVSLYWPDLLLLVGLFLSAMTARRITLVEPVLLACLVPLFVVLRWTGAEYNHFLPVVILAKAAGGILLVRLTRSKGLGGPAAALVLALLVVPSEALSPRVERLIANQAQRKQRQADLEQIMVGLPGPILTDAEAAYLFLGQLPRTLTVYDAFETSIYERLGLLRPAETPLAQAIRDRRFALVLTTPIFQPKGIVSLLNSYYRSEPTSAGPTLYRPRTETAVLGIARLRGPIQQAGLTVYPAAVDALESKTGFVTADGRDSPGRLILTLDSARPITSLKVMFFPRQNLADPASMVTLEAERVNGTRVLLWSRKGSSGTGWDPEPGDRVEVSLSPSVAAITRRLIYTLSGPAQLWFDEVQPLVVAADLVPGQKP